METSETVQGGIQDAGAVTLESASTAVQGVPDATSAGAVTPESQSTAVEGAEGTVSQDGETTSQEPQEGQEGYKKSFEERMSEIKAEAAAEAEQRIMSRLQQEMASRPPQPTFAPDEKIIEIRQGIANVNRLVLQLQSDISVMEDGDPELMDKTEQILELQDRIRSAQQFLVENGKARADYINKTQESERQRQETEQINNRIAVASEMVAKEYNIPPEVWKKAETFFQSERMAKPLMDQQYRDIRSRQGEVAAILWAKEYVDKNMGKSEQSAIQQKEAAKESLPSGKTNTGVVVGNPQLDALKALAASTGNSEDLARYMTAKKAAQTS